MKDAFTLHQNSFPEPGGTCRWLGGFVLGTGEGQDATGNRKAGGRGK